MMNRTRISETATNDQNSVRRENALWITMALGGIGLFTTAFYTLVAFQLHQGHLVIPIIIMLLFAVVAFIANGIVRRDRVTLAILICIAELAIAPVLLAFFLQGVSLPVGLVAFLLIVLIATRMLSQRWVLYSVVAGVIGSVLAGMVDYYVIRWQVLVPVIEQFTPWVLGVTVLIFGAFVVRQFRSMPLTSKLIIVLLASTLIAATAVTGFTISQTTSALTRNVGGQLKSLADADAWAIGNFLDSQIQALTILAGSKTLEDAVVTANDAYLGMDNAAIQAEIARRQEEWLAAMSTEGVDAPNILNTLVGPAAVDLAKYRQASPANLDAFVTDRYGGLVAASTRVADYDQADQPWWQAAYNQGRGNFVFVSPGTIEGDGKEQILVFATPVYDRLGNVIGVLRAAYSFSAIAGLLKTTGETGQSFLLFPTDPPQQFHQGVIAPADASLLAAMASIGTQEYKQYNFDEQQRFVSTSRVSASLSSPWVDSVGWDVVVSQDLEEMLTPVNAQIHLTTILVIIVAGMIAIIAAAVAGVIAKPILSLKDVATRVSTGDLSARATVQSYDEIGDLAGAFNAMTARLRDLIGGLEQEIAERKRVEQALRESEGRYRQLVNNANDIIYRTDANGHFTFVNPIAIRITGYSEEEMIGKHYLDLVQPDFRKDAGRFYGLQFVKKIPSTYYEFPMTTKEGEEVWLGQQVQLIMEGDSVVGFQAVVRDITERKRAEEELEKHRDHLEELVRERTAELTVAKEQAEAASHAKSIFLAQMSHELRTPLNAILGYAQILQRRPLDANVIDNLRTVQRSGEHLLTLINDILDIAKIEAGRVELYPIEIGFPSFLEHIVSIVRARAEAKGLAFNFAKLSTLPFSVQADETRLRQVLLNLLDNAVKFTDEGQITLRVSAIPNHLHLSPQVQVTQYPIPNIRFEVQDTGIGIPSEQLKHIFMPFEQVGALAHRTKGTGLGLAISRQLVGLMGGELHVQSEPGRGSTFWFEVALPVMEVAREVTPSPRQIVAGYKGPQRTVLVVDDVPSNRAVLVDLLEPLGFDVVEAADGQQAIHLAQELRPDLILMDRWMPVLDGFEATQQMRRIPELKEVPVIAISASVSEKDQAHSQEVGLDAFLPKPVNWTDLAALLEEHLGLEWEYEEEKEKGDGEQGETVLVPPPQEELTILLDLALRGNMRAIRERAANIETLGEQYVPFARKLRELVKGFEEQEILALVKQHIEEEK